MNSELPARPAVPSGLDIVWPRADCTRVPFEVFFDEELYRYELDRIFSGPHWQYLALEEEIPKPGDYITTYLGERCVVVNRGPDHKIYAFENRCAHRGAQVVNRIRGNSARFNCPYHLWCYDHAGNLLAVSQQKGVRGKGGMPDDFEITSLGLKKLKVAAYKSLIFGTFVDDIVPIETYLGPIALKQIDRIMSRPIRVLGYYRQVVEANWKLYAENTRDPYHAPLLHLFHVSFGIQTPAMKGGSYMDAEKKNNCIIVITDPEEDAKTHDLLASQYSTSDKYRPGYRLKDPRLIGTKRSINDDINLVINTIFPSLVVAQVENAFQIRHLRPKGPEKFEILWTYFGFDDSDAGEMEDKLRLANMIGPAGFISMEDGEAARLVQKAVRTQQREYAFVEMGGRGEVKDQDHLVQEVAIRGFWQYYRKVIQFSGDCADAR